MEVNEETGEARVRSAYTPGGSEVTGATAHITFRGDTATVTDIGADEPTVTLPGDSFFRESGERGLFMCTNGCSGHYSADNRKLMKDGQVLAAGLPGRG